LATVSNGVLFSSLFRPAEIICHTDHTHRDPLLMELLRQLAVEQGVGNVGEAYEAVLERENEIPSIIGPHIAVPHARLDALKEIVVGVATSKEGIKYSPEVDDPIKLMILILVPKTAPGLYLQVLSSIAKVCQDAGTADAVAEMTSAKEIWKFFKQGGSVLADYVRTKDIMNPVDVKLHENDTLEQAIDLFVKHGQLDLPVVDKENELIGVVTTYELLKVCLPDYILWMDDLTPILNFEPFAEVLRNESKTWLAEIMTSDYATITEEEPAIQVAKEITRQQVNHAYVLKGKKLVGVVSLEDFLRKVLRE